MQESFGVTEYLVKVKDGVSGCLLEAAGESLADRIGHSVQHHCSIVFVCVGVCVSEVKEVRTSARKASAVSPTGKQAGRL